MLNINKPIFKCQDILQSSTSNRFKLLPAVTSNEIGHTALSYTRSRPYSSGSWADPSPFPRRKKARPPWDGLYGTLLKMALFYFLIFLAIQSNSNAPAKAVIKEPMRP